MRIKLYFYKYAPNLNYSEREPITPHGNCFIDLTGQNWIPEVHSLPGVEIFLPLVKWILWKTYAMQPWAKNVYPYKTSSTTTTNQSTRISLVITPQLITAWLLFPQHLHCEPPIRALSLQKHVCRLYAHGGLFYTAALNNLRFRHLWTSTTRQQGKTTFYGRCRRSYPQNKLNTQL